MRIAVQAWLDWRAPSGARTRLRGLMQAIADLPESRDLEIHLLGSQDPDPCLQALCKRYPHLHWHPVFPVTRHSVSRTLNETRLLLPTLQALQVGLLDIASLPIPNLRIPDLHIPICLTLHDLRDLGSHARGLRRFAIHQSLEHAVDRAAVIVLPSPTVARELAERHPNSASKLHVVPPALDPKPFQCARPLAGLPQPYFLHLGRPEPRKNLPFLVEVYQRALAVETALPPLVLAGPGLTRDELPRALARALSKGDRRIHLIDSPCDASLPSLLRGARALLFPSTLEGFGMPALEALAAQVPVLAPTGSVQAEVAGLACLALPIDQPQTWTRALLSLAHSSAVHARLRQATRSRLQAFSPETAARALLEAWHTCANNALPLLPCQRARSSGGDRSRS